MLRGEIVLENGDRCEFFLNDSEVRKLEYQVKRMNEYLRSTGGPEDWNIVKELKIAILDYLDNIPDPADEETPGAATPGESR